MNAFLKEPLVVMIVNALVGGIVGVGCGLLVALLIIGINGLISPASDIYHPTTDGLYTLAGMIFGSIIGSVLGGVVGIRRVKSKM